jgi:glutaredoxin
MEFQRPSPIGFTVYTKSNCVYCDRIKELFKNMEFQEQVSWINADPFLSNHRDAFLQFLESIAPLQHNRRTFPVVFLNGDFLGGFQETSFFLLNPV